MLTLLPEPGVPLTTGRCTWNKIIKGCSACTKTAVKADDFCDYYTQDYQLFCVLGGIINVDECFFDATYGAVFRMGM